MNKLTIPLLLLILFIGVSCANKVSNESNDEVSGAEKLLYAKHFSIANAEQFTVITVFNPWKQGEVYDKYYLVKDESITIPNDGHKVLIPVRSMMANSATHLGFLELLGELDKVKGVCNADFIYNPLIRKGIKDGSIEDLGDAFNLDIERLLLLRPQIVMTSAYNAEDENSKRIRQTGLTVLYNIEWQENTLLGRAEWIKFIGTFFDKQKLADSIFNEVETTYNNIKRISGQIQGKKPTVLSGQDFRGTWSMPGGKNYNAILFEDAGADYYYKNDNTTGSIPTTVEEALLYFSKADIWVGAQAATLEELGKTDSRYKLFKAYRDGNVYNINKRMNATGGNDYWESGVARPDLLLSDMIKIFHPDVLPDYELTYMEKLVEK